MIVRVKETQSSFIHTQETAMDLQLIATCSSTSIRELQQIKEYIVDFKKLHHQGQKHLPVISFSHEKFLADAIDKASLNPKHCLILACGYSTAEIRLVLDAYDGGFPCIVLSHPPEHTERYHIPTASLLEERVITRVRSLKQGIHKAVLRYTIRQLGEIRPITKQSELDHYFSLRFRAWNEMGYMTAGSDLQQEGWEIDHFDRFSIPIGFFTENNELVACCRLVQQFGKENAKYVNAISKLIGHESKPGSAHTFSYQGTVEQPFDILCEFKGFREYYRSLIREQATIAEVSRVVVDPAHRGIGLAEVMVDSLVSVAKVQDIDVFMLACREVLSSLYERCGFTAVPNLVSEKFLTIPEKSIVMERKINKG